MKILKLTFAVLLMVVSSCSTRPYTNFLIEPEVEVAESMEDSVKTPTIDPRLVGEGKTITMRWNDGQTYSEIDIPLSSAGRVIIDHKKAVSTTDRDGPQMVLPTPSRSDTLHLKMHNAYLGLGLVENTKSPTISLSRARALLDDYTNSQNYARALMVSEAVLARYPSHPEFLKAQGSLFLLVGEKDKAIEAYEKSLEIYDDPGVNRKLNELENVR